MASGETQKYMDGTDTGWQPITKDSTYMSDAGTLEYRKEGPLVEVRAYNATLSAESSRSWVTIGKVPEGYRPTIYTMGSITIDNELYSGYVHTNGNIFLYKGSHSSIPTGNIYFNCVYLI